MLVLGFRLSFGPVKVVAVAEEGLARVFRGENQAPFICPHCQVLSLHQLTHSAYGFGVEVGAEDLTGGEPRQALGHAWHRLYRCVNCAKDTYMLVVQEDTVYENVGERPKPVARVAPRLLHQYPVSSPSTHPAVPHEVGSALVEAEKCLAIGAYNACGVMARRAIAALCREKKARGDNLVDQLNNLKEVHVITPDLWEWADELRVVGRAGAHPEWEEVSADDADYAVRFLREIIRYVYINPAERSARRLKERARKVE